eukprot:15119501-Alexandrium_andersonii.AAC.1
MSVLATPTRMGESFFASWPCSQQPHRGALLLLCGLPHIDVERGVVNGQCPVCCASLACARGLCFHEA